MLGVRRLPETKTSQGCVYFYVETTWYGVRYRCSIPTSQHTPPTRLASEELSLFQKKDAIHNLKHK